MTFRNANLFCCRFGVALLLFFSVMNARPARADVVFESATMGPAGQTGGLVLNGGLLVGSWFSLTETTKVTAIGGHVVAQGPGVWASIISLAPGDLPDASFDLESNALVFGLIDTPGSASADLRVNVDATLGPGDYAILMGGTFLGIEGFGTLAKNNTDLPGVSYFGKTSSGWDDGSVVNRNGSRLVVEGFTVVPEPSTFTLFALASMGWIGVRSRRRK